MSVTLDDYARDTVTTRNNKNVIIDTRYVPYPMGHGYETIVFRAGEKGNISDKSFRKPLDEARYGESKRAAEEGHVKMINKWMKEVV